MHNRQPIFAMFSMLVLFALLAALPARVSGQSGFDPRQSPSLANDEAQTVYQINQQRRAQGQPPLRWNRQLTDSARWFAWDATANLPPDFCGHTDTLGRAPVDRNADYSYPGVAPAEIAICSLSSPDTAVSTWMNSPNHRDILLDGNWRETGVGYYQAGSEGYVVQDFGNDAGFAPVVIENEAPGTATPDVGVYIYPQQAVSGFALTAETIEMRIGATACLDPVAWQPYQAETRWTLAPGEGWRDVYAQTRDRYGRTFTAADSIYLGGTPPADEIGAAQMSDTRAQVTVYGLQNGPLPYAQLSLGWLADDLDGNFQLLTGTGSREIDSQALGGTAFRLGDSGDAASTSAWVWTTTFIKNTPMIAYVRAKIASNSGAQEALRFGISAGGSVGTVSIRADQFRAANAYQEFALPFTFVENPNDPFLVLNFWKFGASDVTLDAVTFFSAPMPASAAIQWTVPGGSYRGQGVWARASSAGGEQFSGYQAAPTTPVELMVAPMAITFLAAPDDPPAPQALAIQLPCGVTGWQARSDAGWLSVSDAGGKALVSVDPSGLAPGSYSATLTFSAPEGAFAPVVVQARLELVARLNRVMLPAIWR